jgi:hypothetical protein
MEHPFGSTRSAGTTREQLPADVRWQTRRNDDWLLEVSCYAAVDTSDDAWATALLGGFMGCLNLADRVDALSEMIAVSPRS